MSQCIELNDLERFITKYSEQLNIEILDSIKYREHSWPIYGISIGSQNPEANTFGIFAGVHGLEKIGVHVCLSFLQMIMERKKWDKSITKFLEQNRIISVPLINPYGIFFNQRHNESKVDLMRNAPVEASGKLLLGVSGQRFSPYLPWYRGDENKLETGLVCVKNFIQKHCFNAKKSITIDLHSGFGIKDRIWYPWAKSHDEFPGQNEVNALFAQFEDTYPYHIYKIEPQNKSYLTHGDMWDWIYQLHQTHNNKKTFIPLTLEMGSWIWVKKNPLQLFTKNGPFNPIKKHRYARTMRRHLHLLEYLMREIDNT